jgi:hypothetical protein
MPVIDTPAVGGPPESTFALYLGDSDYREAVRRAKSTFSREVFAKTSNELISAQPASPHLGANVVGLGLGSRRVEGRSTGQLCVKVFVRKKFSVAVVPESEMIPRIYEGIPLDVEESGIIYEMEASLTQPMPNPMNGFDPIQPGVSIGSYCPDCRTQSTGTLGAILSKSSTDMRFGLTCKHVVDACVCEHTTIAKNDVIQPGPIDRERYRRIGRVSFFCGASDSFTNEVDAAAILLDVSNWSDVLYIGGPTGTVLAQVAMPVHKFGRTTQYTEGIVTDVEFEVRVESKRRGRVLRYENQIRIETQGVTPFSEEGDSGALVLEIPSGRALGLLFAGSATFSVANHLHKVLSELGASSSDRVSVVYSGANG